MVSVWGVVVGDQRHLGLQVPPGMPAGRAARPVESLQLHLTKVWCWYSQKAEGIRPYALCHATSTGHTCRPRRLGPGIPVGPGAWDRAYLWVMGPGILVEIRHTRFYYAFVNPGVFCFFLLVSHNFVCARFLSCSILSISCCSFVRRLRADGPSLSSAPLD